MRDAKRLTAEEPPLRPADITRLVVLGSVRAGCAPFEAIAAIARELAPLQWQPTPDVLENSIGLALRDGLVRVIAAPKGDGKPRLEITSQGAAAFRALLRRSVPGVWGGPCRTCVAAKLCFLDDLEPGERSMEVEALAHLYRQTLTSIRQRYDAPAPSPAVSRRWLRHEIDRLEWELDWLEKLRADLDPAADAPCPASPHQPISDILGERTR